MEFKYSIFQFVFFQALVLLMDCYHTLCLSCEDRELKYAGGPNHLIHLKCNKCEVSYLRDSVHHFKQTDLKVRNAVTKKLTCIISNLKHMYTVPTVIINTWF